MTGDRELTHEETARGVAYWLELSEYDLETARVVGAAGRYLCMWGLPATKPQRRH